VYTLAKKPGEGTLKVKLIDRSLISYAFKHPPGSEGMPAHRYYIMEGHPRSSKSLPGFGLMVQRRRVDYVLRLRNRNPIILGPVGVTEAGLTPEAARKLAEEKLWELRQERANPLAAGRRRKVVELYATYLRHLREGGGMARAERTFEGYIDLWERYLIPALGEKRLGDVTPEAALELKRSIPVQVKARARHGGETGFTVANRALQQAEAAWNFATRLKWIEDNPWAEMVIGRYDEVPDDRIFSREEYAALGRTLRDLETQRRIPARTAAALRLLFLHPTRKEEVLQARLSFTVGLDGPYPKYQTTRDFLLGGQIVPRPSAKGDRHGQGRAKGRWVWLSRRGVGIILGLDRPSGLDYYFPGDSPGARLSNPYKSWDLLLRTAGVKPATLKTTRASCRTHAADAGVVDSIARILGGWSHPEAGKVSDAVYLRHLDEMLSDAANRLAEHIACLLGEA
jgi:integrase